MKKIKLLWLPICFGLLMSGCNPNSNSTNTSQNSNDDTSSGTSSSSGGDIDGNLILNVEIPEPLSEDEVITIGSSLNNWTPSNLEYKATKVDDLNYRLVLNVDNTEEVQVEYKWTIQLPSFTTADQWKGVEKDENGAELANRIVTIPAGSTETIEVFDKVAQFADPDAPVVPTVVGNLDIIEGFAMPQFSDNRTRTIRVWTPEGYDKNNKDVKYPVIYMQDGQNLFDSVTSFAGEWEVDETITQFIKDKIFEGAIVVGIDNSSYRMREYTPNWGDTENAEGDLYGKFIVETLKPFIDSRYNVLTDRENTMIAGSSMGGLISFAIGLSYPEVFGMVAGFSSSFQINTKENRQLFINSLDYSKTMPRLYLDAGKLETLYTYIDPVSTELVEAGYPENLIYTLIDEQGQHSETSWRQRFPSALKWLISDEDGNYVAPSSTVNFTLTLSDNAANYIEGLGVDGTMYLYTGQLSASIVLEKGENKNTYVGSCSSKLNDTIEFKVLYYSKGKIEIFGLDETGKEIVGSVLVDQDVVNANIDVADFDYVVKVNISIKVPEGTQDYFDEINSPDAKIYLYTGLLANSYIAEKVDDTTYEVNTFEKPGTQIKFYVLYYGSGVEIFETNADGSEISSIDIVNVGEENVTHVHNVLGWQLPVLMTINITLPKVDVPEGEKLEVGLYGGTFGNSWRDCQIVELQEDGTYSCQVSLFSDSVLSFTVGYVLYEAGADIPYAQKFEPEEEANALFEINIPFSEYQGGIPIQMTYDYTVTSF